MKRIMIVGTAPYDRNCPSRAFESYFSGIESHNLAQIFSYPYVPPKGHCSKLYQITDAMMLKRFFSRNVKVGKTYEINDLSENGGMKTKSTFESKQNSIISLLYRYGKKDRPTTYLLRGLLWKKKNWCTKELNEWLDSFNPECVFLSFSDDFFILRIALYVAERFNIPIISSIADDYYFNGKFSLSPFYYIYRGMYKSLVKRILKRKGSTAVYIGDRIKELYNNTFGIRGITLYLTSDIKRRPFRPINVKTPIISYYGNIRLGRNKSLIDIGSALKRINPNYYINVYSNESEFSYINSMKKAEGVVFHNAVPYEEVQKGMLESDILVIVEGFEPSNVKTVKYSISTKVPDSLATGAQVLAYGDKECGAIDYLLSTKALPVCTDKKNLVETLKGLIENEEDQKKYYKLMNDVLIANHQIHNNARMFSDLVDSLSY